MREHASSVEEDATPSESQGSALGGAHGGIVPPIRGAAAVPYVPPPPAMMSMSPPVSHSLPMSLPYVTPPPLRPKPASVQGSDSQKVGRDDQLADKLNSTTKALEDACLEIMELKTKVLALEKDLAVAESQKHKAVLLSVKLKVSLQPYMPTINHFSFISPQETYADALQDIMASHFKIGDGLQRLSAVHRSLK